MAQFSAGTKATFTPTASATELRNGTLTMLTVGNIASVKMINWGGRGTSLVGYLTRWSRSTTAATGAPTNEAITSSSPAITPVATFPVVYATTFPINAADTFLFRQPWNVQGGGGVVVLPIGGEWFVTGGALSTVYSQIGCGNDAGADANLSGYGMTWNE